jgi:uncharacterized protein (TIGR03435 family)
MQRGEGLSAGPAPALSGGMQSSITQKSWCSMRVFARISLIGLLSSAAFGQPPATAQTFEIADVHVSSPSRNPIMQGGPLRDGRYELRKASMLDLIRTAYDVDADSILGGPSWLEWDRFDLAARTPPSASPAAIRIMLQTLLAERFQLVIHRDTRPLPGFVLTVSKGKPKLHDADGASDSRCSAEPPPPAPGVVPSIAASCRNMTMAEFAATLRELAKDYLGNPVVDSTGLTGTWDFDFRWTPKGPLQAAGADGVSIFDALEKQLGLKLQAEKIPMPVIVVDSVNHTPSPNSSEITAKLSPSPSAEFEVAVIRRSLADTPPPRQFQFQPGGRLTLRGVPLRAMIIQAWDLDPDPHAELIGAPKWLDSARFDVTAKALAASVNGAQIWNDDLQTMLRALLVDRFRMVTHYEDRPVDVYTLIAVKPKLRKADPSNRTGCTSGPAQAPGNPQDGPPPSEVVCRNVTMAQFAERLQGVARSYIRYPVLDATGIEGAWDFTLVFTPAPPPDGGPGPGWSQGRIASRSRTRRGRKYGCGSRRQHLTFRRY